MSTRHKISIASLAAFMIGAGVMHFVNQQFFVDIVPAYLPEPVLLVHISGLFEILGGLGLLLPQTRRWAAFGLMALFVAVFPANINMAVNHITPTGTPPLPAWLVWARLPLQLALIWWAYGIAKRAKSKSP